MSLWDRAVWIRPKPKKNIPGYYLGIEGDDGSDSDNDGDDDSDSDKVVVFAERTMHTDATALSWNQPPDNVVPVLMRDGVSREPVLEVAERLDIVPCILHCTMAIGRLAALYVMQLCSVATAAQKSSVCAVLRGKHLRIPVYARGKDLLQAPSIKGHHTKDLFSVWPSIAVALGVENTPGDNAMRNMGWLLRTLYRTKYEVLPTMISEVTVAFREACVGEAGRRSNYLHIMEFDMARIIDHLYHNRAGYGLGMFSQDIPESLNRLLKDAFVSYSNRGGGKDGHKGALKQAWQRVHLERHVPLMLTGKTKKQQCQNRDAFRGADSDGEATGNGCDACLF